MPSPPAPTSRSRRTTTTSLKLRDATIASRDVEQRVRATQLTGQSAGAQADIANAGVDALTVRAPMDGQLTALDAEVGQSKAQGAVLGQVNSADRFKLTAQVDEFYLGQMSVGQESLFTVGRPEPAREDREGVSAGDQRHLQGRSLLRRHDARATFMSARPSISRSN